ncbi:IS66 family transposase [Fluviicola taffensis]|uniref:IS66 family transposase n=1 Tax=Fluviicola taffensis TaxID=191579 RepID=UPI0031381E83
MEPSTLVLDAMQHCSYKAWQLAREESEPKLVLETSKRKLTTYNQRKISDAQLLITKEEPPPFYQNKHCPECKYKAYCHSKLKERDCISLLGNISLITISKYNKKGIFSILQLSHTFRPRRRGSRKPTMATAYLWELKALAIREKKTYVMYLPEILDLNNCIYIDFEGTKDNSIYLIGVKIKQENQQDKIFSFWADSKEGEETIFDQFFRLINEYPDVPIFHYGSYEIRAFKSVIKKYPKLPTALFTKIERRMVNVLSYFRTYIYPPTYSNGLKEIANHVGFAWQVDGVTGLDSLTWREQWETSKENTWKDQLIQYNCDDCNALEKVTQWIQLLATGAEKENIAQVVEMKRQSPYKFQSNEFNDDYNYINKAAYFDYQRNRIYWRNKKGSTSVLSGGTMVKKESQRGIPRWNPTKVHEQVFAQPLKRCPKCGNTRVYQLKSTWKSKIQTDLKFTSWGVQQHIVQYWSMKAKCKKCNNNYNNGTLRMFHYGDNLFAWAVNLYVNYHVSHDMICKMLYEQFGIEMFYVYLIRSKGRWWLKWQPEVDYVKKTVFNSPFLHMDETSFKLSKDKGYVWAFATTHSVYYHFTFNREADFLKEWLKGYQGVIITDSFAGYDGLNLKRQKCLIHLIRDLNDDLHKNPFDEEYKLLVNEFGSLLKRIVETVDRYGLQKKYLEKHTKDTEQFVHKFLETQYESELAVKCIKRLKKNWSEYWTFLHHDNVPWNNNNAEVAVKAVAMHRRGTNGQMNENGIRQYLEMLSISQTCRYRSLSFLDVLRGKTGLWQKIPEADMPGFLPFSQARMYTRKLGFERKKQWTEWKQLGKRPSFIPANPEVKYKNDGWKSWHDWIGFSFMPFEKARTYMRKLGLKNRDEYWKWSKSEKRPKTIPASPEKEYKYTGWIDLGDWLGTGNQGQQPKKRMTYEQAKTYIRSLGIKTQHEYYEWRKSGQRPETIPSDPSQAYITEFEGWGKFLGTDRIANQCKNYCTYTEAKTLLKPLHIRSMNHFRELYGLGFIPENIPKNPYAFYNRRNEWVSFADFHGRG